MKRILIILLIVLNGFAGYGQDSLRMRLTDFYRLILQYHPLARQAANLPDMARKEIRTARGAFDPVLKSVYEEKKFDQKNYWSIWESGLVVPVWTGADVKIAYDQNKGRLLDDQFLVPEEGLSYFGISVPLGQGLLIDQRRASLRQAQQLEKMAEAERVKAINKLLLTAAKSFWDWQFTYRRLQFHEEGVRLASQRFEAVRGRVLFGDLPAIDSLEAYIEVQNRRTILLQSEVDFQNARLIASNFLWDENQQPVKILPALVPVSDASERDTMHAVERDLLLELAKINHPELIKLQAKRTQLEIEKRLAQEKLRPKFNFDYNFLSEGQPGSADIQQFSLNNNYKMGFTFSMPLFLREERGKLGLARLKIQQTTYDQQQITRDILTDINTAWNELNTFKEQVVIQEEQTRNAALMLDAELFRFNNGESSVFLVNTRENALVNARIKLAELQAKYEKSKAVLLWAAGVLFRL